ncbi:MAG: peptidylprolyl isomerase [Pseudomonadota bacterium]
MTKVIRFIPLALAVAVFAGPVHAQNAAAKVNGVVIPQSRVDEIVAERVAQGQPDSPQLRQSVRDSLITQEVVAQEALRQGIDKQPEVATRLELARQNVLIRSYLDGYFKKNPVSDDAVKKEYDKLKTQMGDKEYKTRHILVENEADAKKIIADVKGGASFEKLAQEKSKDPGSGANGGDLGWSVPANYVKPFADALTRLKKGEMTQQPVQSQFGWHVIKLEDTRPLQVPALDDVKDNIRQQLQQQELQKLIAQLRTKAKIE